MSGIHEFFTREHEGLNRIEAAVVSMRNEIDSARTGALADLKAKRQDTEAKREALHQRMAGAVSDMQRRLQVKKQETEAAVEDWKRRREVHKLESRARAAEEYASAAMTVLSLAQEEARAAALDAIEARREAQEANEAAAAAA